MFLGSPGPALQKGPRGPGTQNTCFPDWPGMRFFLECEGSASWDIFGFGLGGLDGC